MAITGPGTVNDDFERFIVELRIGHVLEGEVRTFQFPKLTEAELQLWENREPDFLSSFQVQPEGAEPGEFHAHPIEFIRISGSRMTILKETVTVSTTHHNTSTPQPLSQPPQRLAPPQQLAPQQLAPQRLIPPQRLELQRLELQLLELQHYITEATLHLYILYIFFAFFKISENFTKCVNLWHVNLSHDTVHWLNFDCYKTI